MQRIVDEAAQRRQKLGDMIVQLMGDWKRQCNPINGMKLFLECQHFLQAARFTSQAEFLATIDSLISAGLIFRHPKSRLGGPTELWLTLTPPETPAA